MRGKIKTARKEASKLHGAEATFVSLVDAGANETPFTIVKSADGAKAMSIKKRSKTKKSHKALGTKKKAATPETTTETLIAKMVFSSEHFADEAAVEAYIDEAEWEAETVSIVKNDDGNFEARPNGLEDDDFTKIAKVNLDGEDGVEGVEAYVGERQVEVEGDADDEDDDDTEVTTETKSDEDKDEDDDEDEDEDDDAETEEKAKGKKKPTYSKGKATPAKKAAPKQKLSKRQQFLAKRADARSKEVKFDQWDAHFSKGNTLAKTLKDGMSWDGTPPGFYDVQAAFNSAVANIVTDDGMEGGKQEALNKAAADYSEIIGGLDTFFDAYVESDEETIAKAFDDEDEREALSKWAEDFADFANSADDEAPAVEKKTVKKAALQSTASEGADTTNVVALVQKALEPVVKQVEGIGETVEALSTRAPTKKAADATDGDPAAPRALKKAKGNGDDTDNRTAMQKMQERAIFG